MKVPPIHKLDSDLDHLKDEDYLIFKAKEEQKHDMLGAKCWLITAQTIYPENFRISLEIYNIAKQERSLHEASDCLKTMFQNFRHESALRTEIDSIMKILYESTSSSSFLSQIFFNLPKDVQKGMILYAAESSKDNTMKYCSLMLLLTSTFPESTAFHGLKLVDALIKAENLTKNPLNPYRKKLVCELLPRLLRAEGLEVRPKTLYHLLTKSIEFYVAYVTTPAKVAQAALESETGIDDPWHELFAVVRLIGWNLGWELASEFDLVSNRELILQRIQAMVEGGARLGGGKDTGEDVREILFTTVTIFLHALLDYTHRLYPDFTQGDTPSTFPPPLTLVEAFVEKEEQGLHMRSLMSPKRLRPSIEGDLNSPAFITVSRLTPQEAPPPSATVGLSSLSNSSCSMSPGALSQALITAIKCWDLLHAYEKLRSEFVIVLEGLSIERWLIVFNMDVLIYEGRLPEAEQQLRHTLSRAKQSPPNSHSHFTTLTLTLKLASVLFSLEKFSAATEAILEVVSQLGPLSNHGGFTPNLVVPAIPKRRHLHLLALTKSQCLQFIATLLIHSLRHLIVVEGNTDDLCIGHLLVVLQLEWPRYNFILEELLAVVQKKGSFAYQYFAPFVTTPDILEEFMFMAMSLGYQMDILPQPSKQQRMSTRGADRGSKQDFKSAMKKQMLRCHESVETNVLAFLRRQGPFIPHVFMS